MVLSIFAGLQHSFGNLRVASITENRFPSANVGDHRRNNCPHCRVCSNHHHHVQTGSSVLVAKYGFLYMFLTVHSQLGGNRRLEELLSICSSIILRGQRSKPSNHEGHQGVMSRIYRKDCEYSDMTLVEASFNLLGEGYFPCQGGVGIWDKNGWGRVSEESWTNTSWTPRFRHS